MRKSWKYGNIVTGKFLIKITCGVWKYCKFNVRWIYLHIFLSNFACLPSSIWNSLKKSLFSKQNPFLQKRTSPHMKVAIADWVALQIYLKTWLPFLQGRQLLCFYAALTHRRISLRLWKFEIRGKIAENHIIGREKYWKKNEALWMLAKLL